MIQHDVTKWTINDVYGQCIHAHPLTICITFATKFYFYNYFYDYQIPKHYLPHVLNYGNFKTMFLNIEKNLCYQIPMT
jgi:hypothetical protein